MKNTGKCPKCLATEIYSDNEQEKRDDRAVIPVTAWKSLIAGTYLCLNWGCVEEYIRDKDLKTKNERVKTNWKKYSPSFCNVSPFHSSFIKIHFFINNHLFQLL